jgi:hypothetical protein
MAVLEGEKLEKYFNIFGDQLSDLAQKSQPGSLPHLLHTTMSGIMESEKEFLEWQARPGRKPSLNIMPNGYPSLESLIPDIKAIRKLGTKKPEFASLAQNYGINIDIATKRPVFQTLEISPEEWKRKNSALRTLETRLCFDIGEESDQFKLTVIEAKYQEGFDSASSDVPVIARRGIGLYKLLWGILLFEGKYTHFTNQLRNGRAITAIKSTQVFNSMGFQYSLDINDYTEYVVNRWLFVPVKDLPRDEDRLLAASLNARIQITMEIAEALESAYGTVLYFEGKAKQELPDYVRNYVGKEEQIDNGTKRTINQVYITDVQQRRIGEIYYCFPSIDFSSFTSGIYKGSIHVNIAGASIADRSQYELLRKNLSKVHK